MNMIRHALDRIDNTLQLAHLALNAPVQPALNFARYEILPAPSRPYEVVVELRFGLRHDSPLTSFYKLCATNASGGRRVPSGCAGPGAGSFMDPVQNNSVITFPRVMVDGRPCTSRTSDSRGMPSAEK